MTEASFATQFGHPRGVSGWLVGHLMALKNGGRSRWALGVLSPRPGERVLEIGCGPGVDVRRLHHAVGPAGYVAGVDISREMIRQARARNRSGVAAGNIELRQASALEVPFAAASLDAVYSTNSVQFWPDLALGVREIARVLREGGRALVSVQPMWRGASAADSRAWADRLEAAFRAANAFGAVALHVRERGRAPAVAVLAIRAGATPS